MLRLLVVLLLLANALFMVWSLGWLDRVSGLPAVGDRDPQRLERQIEPQRITLIDVAGSGAPSTPAPPDPPPSASAATSGTGSAPAAVLPAAPASLAPALAASASAAAAPRPASATNAAPAPGSLAAARSVSGSASRPASPTAAASRPAAEPVSAPAAPAGTPTAPAATPTAPAASAPSAGLAVPAATAGVARCLEAGPYEAAALSSAEGLLRATSANLRWTRHGVPASGEWTLYMGPYTDDETLERKKAELARIRGGIPYQVIEAPAALALGISLGRFDSPAAGEQRLQQYRARGIRTARVVRSGDGQPRTLLRIDQAEPALADRLAAMRWPDGRGFNGCADAR